MKKFTFSKVKTQRSVERMDPWREGYAAAQNRAAENDNPYDRKTETSFYMGWRSGWCDWTYQDPADNYCGGY